MIWFFAFFFGVTIAAASDRTYLPPQASNLNYRYRPNNYPYVTQNYPSYPVKSFSYQNPSQSFSHTSTNFVAPGSPHYPYSYSNYPHSSSSNPYSASIYPQSTSTYSSPIYPPTSTNYPYSSLYGGYFKGAEHYTSGAQPYYNTPPHILSYNSNNNGEGVYKFDYQTENGIKQQEVGQPKHIDVPEPATVVQGSYSYIAPNGDTISVDYVADENGFQPSGDHIPVQKFYHSNPYAASRRYYDAPQLSNQYGQQIEKGYRY